MSNLYNSQAQPGSDYVTMTSASVLLMEGQVSAALPITILPDLQPELNEKFTVILNSEYWANIFLIYFCIYYDLETIVHIPLGDLQVYFS